MSVSKITSRTSRAYIKHISLHIWNIIIFKQYFYFVSPQIHIYIHIYITKWLQAQIYEWKWKMYVFLFNSRGVVVKEFSLDAWSALHATWRQPS